MEPIQLLQQMVEIESLSGQEQKVAEYLTSSMQSLGFKTHIDPAGNAVGILGESNENTKDIVLLGHMDVVAGKVPVRQEQGKLYGRGTVDAKGPLATFIMAASAVKPDNNWRIIVIGAVEEEAPTSKGAHHVAGEYKPEYCIIGEPSSWDGVTLGYKGRLIAEYQLEQNMGHSAGPETTVAEVAVDWWHAIQKYAQEFNQEREKLFEQLLIALQEIQTSSDGLTETARAIAGFRLPPEFDTESFKEQMRTWGKNADIQFYSQEKAFATGRSNPLARAFIKSLRQKETKPRFKKKTGTSDMNVVGPQWNCPIVAYGPGDSNLDHTPNEHIVISEYLQAIEVLTQVLREICK